MKNHIKSILAITAIVLAACSNINNYDHFVNTFIADEELSPMQSINSLKAVDLFVLNDQHIALVAQNGKSYLLTTANSCENMHFAKKLVLLNSNNGVVKVNESKIARLGDKFTECTVTGLYKLHSVQMDSLYNAYVSSFSNPQGSVHGSSSYPRGI